MIWVAAIVYAIIGAFVYGLETAKDGYGDTADLLITAVTWPLKLAAALGMVMGGKK